MKAYVIPVERACNASCHFCITDYKRNEVLFNGRIDPRSLTVLEDLGIDSIEITGGGEPFLHPRILEILSHCSERVPTQVYTNGFFLREAFLQGILEKLRYLCVSRMHHDYSRNFELMGIDYDTDLGLLAQHGTSIKFSLVLSRLGIYTLKDVYAYLDWAYFVGAKKVVIRQLFEADPATTTYSYVSHLSEHFVSSEDIFKEMHLGSGEYTLTPQGNPVFSYTPSSSLEKSMEVEIEYRSCACEATYPLLRADGSVYLGWTRTLWKDRVGAVC